MGVLDYSTTPSSNTAIGGIGIAGSDSIKNGDDAMRQMMADTRAAVTRVADKTAGSYTAAKSDHNQMWRVTGAATINLTAAATLTAGWCLWVMADGATATIDPAGSEQINGAATLALADGNSALIICTATAFRAVIFNAPFDSDTLGNAAGLDVGTTAGTVAAGDDIRFVPTGALIDFPSSSVPTGYLVCDGSTFDSATYPALYAFLGSTTLPDLTDRVKRMTGALAGSAGTTQEDAMQRITGSMETRQTNTFAGALSANGSAGNLWAVSGSSTSYKTKFDSGDSPGARVSDDETRVKAFIVVTCIKT